MKVEEIEGLAELWSMTQGHPSIRVAVIDGPVDTDHPTLAGSDLLESPLWARTDKDQTSLMALHGTHVTSLMFGRGALRGVCPDCQGYLIPLLPPKPRPVPQLDLARAIEEAVEKGAHIINVSAGQYTDSGAADDWLLQAVRLCRDNNVLLVAAAGNDGCDCLHVPASLPGCLAVGAMDESGRPLDFSNWGEAYLENGLLAPGKDLLGAAPGGGLRALSGTSFAAPIVSGVAALLLSLQLARGQTPDPAAVGRALLAGCQRCTLTSEDACRRWLVGKLDVAGALAALASPSAAAPPEAGLVAASPAAGIAASAAEELPKVFALGTVSYEFASLTRRDSFMQLMRQGQRSAPNPYEGRDMAAYLRDFPTEGSAVIWVLNLDHSPLYALEPVGPEAEPIYAIFREWLEQSRQLQRVSLAGLLTSRQVQLVTGQWLPVLEVARPAGLWGWNLDQLVASQSPSAPLQKRLREFVERVYFELRNPGQSSADRALNFTATNLTQAHQALSEALEMGMQLARVRVEPSPFVRADCDGWDVVLEFFDPEKGGRGRLAYRLSVDVTDLVPVSLGPVRSYRVAG